MNRVILHLNALELDALRAMSHEDFRPPDQTLRFLLQREAKARGFLNEREGDGARLDSKAVTLTQKHPNGASPSIGGSNVSVP
jgi:hypothetical protein